MTNETADTVGPRIIRSSAAAVHQARLQTLRLENSAHIAEWIRTAGYATVADVAEATGLSKPTVKDRLTDLQTSGVVIEVEKMDPVLQGSGRPASRYSFDADSAHVIGVDLATNRERIAIANLAGEIIVRDDRDVDADLGFDARLKDLKTRVQQLSSKANRPIGRLAGVGVATPNPLGSAWANANVHADLSALFDAPVHVEHELNAASIAESMMGAAKGIQNFVIIDVDNPPAVGLFIRGEVYSGSHDAAGEIYRLTRPDESTELIENLARLIVTVDPEAVFVRGLIAEAQAVVDRARTEVPARIQPALDIRVELPALGQDGPLLGVTLQALANATARLIGPAATSPRSLFEGSRPQL